MENLLTLSRNRFATKEYNNQKITKKDLNYLFEVTNNAPTSLGIENWRMINLSTKKIKNEVVMFFQMNKTRFLESSNTILFVVKTVDAFNYDNPWLKDRAKSILLKPDQTFGTNKANDPTENQKMLDYIINQKPTTEWSIRQAYIALGFLLLAATELKINSTPAEGFDQELTTYLFNKGYIAADEMVCVACLLGYAEGRKHPMYGLKTNRRIPFQKKVTTI